MRRITAGALLLVAGSCLYAQTAEKSAIAIPEPLRNPQPPQQPFVLTTLLYGQPVDCQNLSFTALAELIQVFKTSTDSEVVLRSSQCQIKDSRFSQAALIYMTCPNAILRLSDEEKKKLGERLLAGSLLYAERLHAAPLFVRQLKALVADPLVLGTQGMQWEQVPKDHPLYFPSFESPDDQFMRGAQDDTVAGLEMLKVRGRVAVLLSDLDLSYFWSNRQAPGRDQRLQFGVNLIVFAMAQRATRF